MKKMFCLSAALILSQAACRTTSEEGSSTVLDASTISPPFASGEVTDLKWAIRFNFPDCNHPGQKPGAWCESTDATVSAKKSGIEDHLELWVNDPKVKSIKMAYFSFSNKNTVRMLCKAATDRGLKAVLYIHGQSIVDNVNTLKNCSPQNIQVIERGTIFGTQDGYLQHAKIFLASELENMKPQSDLTGQEATDAQASTVRVASSSANMSSYGTSLHFENWMFFDAAANTQLAQQNLCFFKGIEEMQNNDRNSYAAIYKDCREKIQAPVNNDIVFYPNPHGGINPEPYKDMIDLVKNAQQSIKIGIHRFTSTGLFEALAEKAATIPVSIIMDDDTLRTGVKNGGAALDVGANDVQAYRAVRNGGAKVTFMETNADTNKHLFHNKFMVVDEKILFAGAGNFTTTSLNAFGNGNFEQFYIIRIPAMVKAYSDAWERLHLLTTPADQHAVGLNQERDLTCNGICDFTN